MMPPETGWKPQAQRAWGFALAAAVGRLLVPGVSPAVLLAAPQPRPRYGTKVGFGYQPIG
jgi:hypothetical protein